MSDNNLRIGLSRPTAVVGRPEREATLTNAGPGTVYYKKSSDVSSTSNDGSLAPGGSVSFKDPRWFIASGQRARAYVVYTPEPTTDMATQDEFDKFAIEVKEEIAVGTGTLPWVDPYDHGFDPIAADNTEAINDSIAALPEAGGRVLMPSMPVYCAGSIDITTTNRRGVILEGVGSPLPGTFEEDRWPVSSLIYTGEGERFIDARSSLGTLLLNLGVGYSEPFEGVLVDFSHNGAADSQFARLFGCTLQGVGRTEGKYHSTASTLVSFDQAIFSEARDCFFDHAQAGIRGMEAGTYSNVCQISNCVFTHLFAGVVNLGQTWVIDGNTFEGLQGDNPFVPMHAVLNDLPGGGSTTGVIIRNNWCGDAFGNQEWIKLKPLVGSKIEGNFFSGGLGSIRFFNNEESNLVGSGVSIVNNNCSTPKGFGIDLTNEDAVIWEGLEIAANGLGANFAESPILNIPTGSPDRDVSIHSNYLRNPPPIVQPYFLTHTSKFTIAGGLKPQGDFEHTGTKFGINGATPVVKANALTAINSEEVDIVYGEAEKKLLENLRTRSEQQETILKNLGVQK